MDESEASNKRNPIVKFFASPLDGVYPAPMRELADWSSLVGIVLFIIAVFALPWLTIGVKNLFGISKALGLSKSFGLFVSPWAWLMVVALVAMVAGLWFVQTRGAILLAAGIYCILFDIVFFVGVWKKVNGIIGDVVSLAKSIPFVGELLRQAILQLVKSVLNIHVAAGFWLFIPAGLLLIIGGSFRLARKQVKPMEVTEP
ncbi:MAG TPA: hypothetical protein VIK22_00500 [Candidatus Anoxymicrobiaceae bacterium]|jgi:hypothetical protein